MSKSFVRALLVLIICLSSVSVIVAQGPRVASVRVAHQQPGSCETFIYFDLAGFAPNSDIFAESPSYSEVSCQTGQLNTSSWPKGRIGTTDGNGFYPHSSFVGGVSGTYTYVFSDFQSQVSITVTTNAQGELVGQSGGSGNQVPVQPTPVPNVPQQGDTGKYPQGHDGVVWGGIHFGNYCGAQGFAEYNDGVNGSSWGCNGQSWNLDQVCRDIYGDALPYVSYKGTGLGDVFCSATPSNGGQPPAKQPDQMPSVSDKWCAVQRFDTDPATDRFLKGTEVHLFGRGGDCHPGNNGLPRATRYSIDGVLFGEKQMSENSDVLKTSGYSIGNHVVCFMVAADSDTTWEHRDEQCRTYTIYGQGDQPPADGNNNPVPTSNDCPGVLPSLVKPGTIAIVNTASNSNINVRSEIRLSKDAIIDKLAPRSLFTIIRGPFCAEGYRWWEIGYNGRGGYAAEADGVGYMYVPNGTTLPYDPTGSVAIQPEVPVIPIQPPDTTNPMPLSYTEIYQAPFTSCVSSGVRQQNATVFLVDTGFSNSNASCSAKLGGLITNGFSWGGLDGDTKDSTAPIQLTPWAEIIQKYTAAENGMVRIDVEMDVNGYVRAIATAKMLVPFGIKDNLKKLGNAIYGLVTGENIVKELLDATDDFKESIDLYGQVWSKGDFSLQAYVYTYGGEQRKELTTVPLYYAFPYVFGKTTNTLYWNAPESPVLLSITVPVSAGQTLEVHTGLSLVAHSWGPVGTYISQDKSYVKTIVFTKVK